MNEELGLTVTVNQANTEQMTRATAEWCRTRCASYPTGLEAQTKLSVLFVFLSNLPNEVLEDALRLLGLAVSAEEFRSFLQPGQGRQLLDKITLGTNPNRFMGW